MSGMTLSNEVQLKKVKRKVIPLQDRRGPEGG